MKRSVFLFYKLVLFNLITISCDNTDPVAIDENRDKVLIYKNTQDTLLYFTSIYDGVEIPAKVSFPPNFEPPYPAVVVLHGSGGGWKDDDTDNDGVDDVAFVGELSSQNREWAELLNSNGYVAVFPESFYARGTVEARGEWDEPPLKLKINAQGPRSRDAIQSLELLCAMVDEAGDPIVRCEDVGIMGFSDGGTTVYTAVYDHPGATPSDHQWIYDGEFEVPAPEKTSDHLTFAAAVVKYGGAGHHGYFGKISDCEKNVYKPYCPLRVELGEADGLTENNQKLIECMELKEVSDLTYNIYPGAPHGFDTKDDINGPLSRMHTLNFFKEYLKN